MADQDDAEDVGVVFQLATARDLVEHRRSIVWVDGASTVASAYDLLVKHKLLSLPVSSSASSSSKTVKLGLDGSIGMDDIISERVLDELEAIYSKDADGQYNIDDAQADEKFQSFLKQEILSLPVSDVAQDKFQISWVFDEKTLMEDILDAFNKGLHRVLIRMKDGSYRNLSQSDVMEFLRLVANAADPKNVTPNATPLATPPSGSPVAMSSKKPKMGKKQMSLESFEQRLRTVSMMSLTDRSHTSHFHLDRVVSRSIRRLGIVEDDADKPTTIHTSASVVDALKRLRFAPGGTVAVVDDQGKLVHTVSQMTLRALKADDIKLLLLPISEFLKRTGKKSNFVTCLISDTLKNVVQRVIKNHTHAVFVVDSGGLPTAVITLADLICVFSTYDIDRPESDDDEKQED